MTDGKEYFEWVDVAAAMRAARGCFIMVELGAGYAARSVDANVLLQRLNPMPAMHVVVDGSPEHVDWAKRHFATNGIAPELHSFVHAVVNATGAA